MPDGHQHDRHLGPGIEIVLTKRSPLHLKMISIPKNQKVIDLNEISDDRATQYSSISLQAQEAIYTCSTVGSISIIL